MIIIVKYKFNIYQVRHRRNLIKTQKHYLWLITTTMTIRKLCQHGIKTKTTLKNMQP